MRRSYILSAASAIALATGLAASPAMAFDHVDWDWDLKIDVDLDINERIDLEVDPKGVTIVEVEQDFKGDLHADADADDIKIKGDGGAVTVSNTAAALANAVIVSTETAAMLDIDQSLTGERGPAELSARAWLDDVTIRHISGDVDVSNTAQAIGNYVSLTEDPLCSDTCGRVDVDEMFAVVNVEQSARMDGYAYAKLDDVNVQNVGGDVSVTNSAIAAGNLVSVTVVRGAIPFPDQD